jgi:hypothetical protein
MTTNNDDISQLSKLLEKTLKLYEEDRKIALNIYHTFNKQLESILDEGALMSEDGSIEKRINEAFTNISSSSKNLTTVIDALVRVITTQLNNTSREAVAKNFNPGSQIPTHAVNLAKLISDSKD